VEWTEEAIEKAKQAYNSGLSMDDVARHMGVSYATIKNLFRDIGFEKRDSGPINKKGSAPPTLKAKWEELRSVSAVARHYSVKNDVIYRWLASLGISPRGPRIKYVAVPNDWAELAAKMTQAELMRHYNCSREQIYKYMAETNIKPIKVTDRPYTPPPPKIVREMSPKVVRSALARVREDMSHLTCHAESAAHYLRKSCANVFKADIRYSDITKETWGFREGLPNGGRQQYFVSGIGILWLDEIIELAKKRGWKEPMV
jgi:transposase